MIPAPKRNYKLTILITLTLILVNNTLTKTSYAANTDMKKLFCIIPIGDIDKRIIEHTQT
jgi:hypothetical protein